MRIGALACWTMPVVLAVLTLGGLIAALLGESWPWKALAWLALGLPLLLIGYYVLPRNTR